MGRRGKPIVGRARDRVFVEGVKRSGLPQTDDDKRKLVSMAWPSMDEYEQKAINRKVRQKLKQPDIKQALRHLYNEVGGFTEGEAIALHIQHIRGFPRQVEIRDEETNELSIETVQDKPNYQALKDYQALMGWTPEKRVRVDQRSVNVNIDGGNYAGPEVRDGPPPTRARAISGGVTINHKVGGQHD